MSFAGIYIHPYQRLYRAKLDVNKILWPEHLTPAPETPVNFLFIFGYASVALRPLPEVVSQLVIVGKKFEAEGVDRAESVRGIPREQVPIALSDWVVRNRWD